MEDKKLMQLTSLYAKKHRGLTSADINPLLKQHGYNILPQKAPPTTLQLIVEQIKSPLVYVLLVASVVTIVLRHFSDAIIILVAVTLNTLLGFVQERRAGNSLEAMKKMIHSYTLVIRDGQVLQIDTENLVPGDVVVFRQGDKITADCRILESNRLYVSEAMLTGESVPVSKKSKDELFMGTVVSGGQVLAKVIHTGKNTKMGKLALSIQEPAEQTPLSKQLAKFSRGLSILVVIIILFVFVLGYFTGRDIVDTFITSVALAVAAIPEGLLVAMTVVLAIGMRRILKRRGLVRNLASAETLGGVTTICTDKTGTLTVGEMTVTEVVGDTQELLEHSAVANDLTDPVEVAISKWAEDKIDVSALLSKFERLDSIPFSSKHMYFATLNKFDESANVIFVNGAPDELIKHCSFLSDEERVSIEAKIESMSISGMRVLGYAKKIVSSSKTSLSAEDICALKWVGLLGFTDPVRKDVKDALSKTERAGIKLVIITGDYVFTALNVVEQLGLNVPKERILLGEDMKDMSVDDLSNWFKGDDGVRLFARVRPEQKLRIIEALKMNGEVVAMLGDGVNDAPALHRADIGIVVNEATEVAKESSDMVLLDSSFTTIVEAIEEGRGIFDNISKVILYLMSDAFEVILAIMFSMISGLPLPVTASQILWINLISDAFPSLALTVDPKRPDIMDLPPRDSAEPLVARWVKEIIAVVSLTGGVLGFGVFYFVLNFTQDLVLARSVAFATFGVITLVYVFSIRMLKEPFWKGNLFENKWLIVAVLMGLGLQVVPFISVNLRQLFNLAQIGWYWLLALASAMFVFVLIELSKGILRRL